SEPGHRTVRRPAPHPRHGGGRVILGLLTMLQVSAAAPQAPMPRITLNQAIAGATRLDPDYVSALGQVDNAEWGRRAALAVFILPSLTASIDATRYSTEFFNVGTGRNQAEAVNATFTASYELFSVRKFTDLGRSRAELEGAQASELQQRFRTALLTESDYYAVLQNQELARVAADRT